MKQQRRPVPADPAAQAREWLVALLEDDVSEEDLAAWRAWLDADAAHLRAYEEAARVWSMAGEAHAPRPSAQDLARDRYTPALSVGQWRRSQQAGLRQVWPMAAALLVACLVGATAGSYLLNQRIGEHQQLMTMRGQHMSSSLRDGSDIRLGAMTQVEVDYGWRTRAVTLRQGEALFEVAHDRIRPFVVTTPLGEVTAVGTAFNIDVQNGAVVLDVTQGTVVVDPARFSGQSNGGAATLRVTAGQRLRLDRAPGRVVMTQSNTLVAPAWTQGRLEYRDEPLRAVIADVNRYATRPIVIADPEVEALAYTGTVQIGAVESWISGLAAVFPLSVDSDRQNRIVLSAKSPRGPS